MNPRASKTSLISVIVPVFNVEDHVLACLESLQRQTLTDIEVIVVDDGSTDDSAARAAAAIGDDPRFQLVTQDNQGLSAARNTGLDLAQGAFVAFVDSDDRVMPDYLQRLHAALEETGADWVACAVRFCRPDGGADIHTAIHGAADLGQHKVRRRYPFDSWSDVVRHFPSAWNKLYRRHLIDGLRFDEGTWFEDHGFFLRAAARTDHILHLPETLYLQTRGRAGQITSSDDERVFEQFDVLDQIRQTLEGSHPGGLAAFERLATRLIYERSTALCDPERRARFAATSAQYLQTQGITYDPDVDVDPEVTHSWALEMAGELPLSVVIPWHGRHSQLLTASLAAVAGSRGPAHEILIVCDTRKAAKDAVELAAPYSQARVLYQRWRGGAGSARNHGLSAARGRYVTFLDAGDTPHPWAYLRWTDALLRAGAVMGVAQFRKGGNVHSGFHDPRVWPTGLPATGQVDLTPMQVLTLETHISAKIFDRPFLLDTGLRFDRGDRPDWAFSIAAALHAGPVAYCGWAGVDIATTLEAQEIEQASFSALRLWRGHMSMIRSLRRMIPRSAQSVLPRGWQRRLYARALRSQLHFGSGRRLAQMRLLAGAALGAALMGFGNARVHPAGLDPFVGPKQRLILDKNQLVHAVLTRLMGRPVIVADPDHSARFAAGHHAFVLRGEGVFRFRTDFYSHDFANLSFHRPDIVSIPFHLSLRFREGQAVCNDSRPDGTWRGERVASLDLPQSGTEIAVHLTSRTVTVVADGQQIFALSKRRLWRRAGLRNLDQITTFTIQGGLRPSEILPQEPGRGALILDSRLQVRAGIEGTGYTLVANGAGEAPTTLPVLPCAGSNGLMAFLPGRIWAALPDDADLQLTLQDNDGSAKVALTVTRADMATRISDLLDLPIDTAEAALILLIVEHLKFGNLMPLLPARSRTRIRALAARLGQADQLVADTPSPSGESTLPDADDTQFHAALAQFNRSQTQKPAPDPLYVLEQLALDPEPRRALFLTLSEFFCSHGQDTEGFVALAQRLSVPLPDPETGLPDPQTDPWTASALLPFLVCTGHSEAAADLLVGLVKPTDGWVLTPPVAFTMQRALQPQDMSGKARRAILRGFMRFVETRSRDYWERTPCVELMRATVALIQNESVLPYPESRKVGAFSLQVYGLSRAFWTMLERALRADSPLPTPLDKGRTQFEALLKSGGADSKALEFFTDHGVAGAARFRREMGAAAPAAPDPNTPTDSREARHVRQHAMPGNRKDAPAGVTAGAVTELYADLPRAPYFDSQRSVGEMLHRLWQSPETQDAALDDQLSLLGQQESHFLGLAIGLTRTLVTQDSSDMDWLADRVSALPVAQRERAGDAPAVRMALTWIGDRSPEWAAALQDLITPSRPLPRPGPADNNGLAQPSAFLDALVVVFSCQPYLDTRIPALRSGWLSQLEALGVPYVIVVGGGEGQRQGDVVYLDAPDDYEGLPQKTLAAIAWVRDNTRFAHMVKIDDDCFLNAPLFFHALSYRKFDYYGRRLTRAPGQMDRAWHQAKSSSDRGRFEFDKSVEPSSYADGGSGYTLSRDAMDAALDAAASPEGQQLIQLSFMEDKMLGDLLALRGITVSEEDYRVTIRRRTYRDAIPVASWYNSFLPGTDAPIQLAHLDTHEDQADALARSRSPGLWPRKIWPTYQAARLGYQTNALELISDEASVDTARAAEVAVVACMRNEMFMLPHFLAHYRRLGVGAFLIADNCSDDGTLEYLAEQSDVALFSVDTDYNRSRYGVAWQQAMMAAFRMDKWSLVADADELLVWENPQRTTLPALLSGSGFSKAEAARIFMLDMYPRGPLDQATFASGDPFAEAGFADAVPFLTDSPMRGPYSDQPAWTSALRHRLIPGSAPNLFTAQKLALLRYRPWMRLSAGLHFVADARLADHELIFAHFKYNAAFREKAQAEVARGQHFNNAEEYRKYMALAAEGRDTIYDPGLSVPWYDSPFVRDLLKKSKV